ncbi:hypothetical protein KAU33_14505, partial [Candidatus Dependentiae bacterium]|nr:hypothetical protein [Candidatus Dependentiae bacterium]
ARELSALFKDHEEFYTSSVSFIINETEDFYINSEGSEAYYNNRKITFSCNGSTILKDGNPYSNSAEITFLNNEKIDEQKIRKLILKFIKDFKNYYHEAKDLKSAYVGPAIYKGAEAGYYFKKYFLGLINGNRRSFDKNTLVLFDSLNKKILPRGTTIIDDPTLKKFKGREVAEFKIDKEGVRPEKVIVVKDGFFRNFLMSKVPIENFPESNGHCKYIAEESYPGSTNIIVTSNRKKTYQQLLTELKRMCREEGLDNGIIFDKDDAYLYNIKTGSLTRLKNVRLVSKSSLPALKKIKMFGNDPELVSFGTTFGTVISPSILVSEVELKKARKENILRPILPAPK